MLFFQISSQILLLKTFEISLLENIGNFRKSRVLSDNLVAIVTPQNLGKQK